jgi:hypothetical protein
MILCFDLDGTVADLYGASDWLSSLEGERAGTFSQLNPLVDMTRLSEICYALKDAGWKILVITWLPKNASPDYEATCTEEKEDWVWNYMPYVDSFHALRYGTPKQSVIPYRNKAVLVDDSLEVRASWNSPKKRTSIDPANNLLQNLERLLG